jgi:hypothetical protein
MSAYAYECQQIQEDADRGCFCLGNIWAISGQWNLVHPLPPGGAVMPQPKHTCRTCIHYRRGKPPQAEHWPHQYGHCDRWAGLPGAISACHAHTRACAAYTLTRPDGAKEQTR